MPMKVANNLAEIFSLLLSEHQDEFSKPALFRTGLKKQKDLNYACGIQIYIKKCLSQVFVVTKLGEDCTILLL